MSCAMHRAQSFPSDPSRQGERADGSSPQPNVSRRRMRDEIMSREENASPECVRASTGASAPVPRTKDFAEIF